MGVSLRDLYSRACNRFESWPWTHSWKLGIGLIIGAAFTWILIGFAGPSTVALTLGERHSLLPPWYLPYQYSGWSQWIVVPALWLAISAAAIGLWICMNALAHGWNPRPWKLFGMGAGLSAATACVLPMTSADVLMYAAYGRIQILGMNPYDITPAEIARQEYDPVLHLTEPPWTDTPSVYGPIATWTQWLAAYLGGDNLHDIVFWLQMLALIPFLVCGLVAIYLAGGHSLPSLRAVRKFGHDVIGYGASGARHGAAVSDGKTGRFAGIKRILPDWNHRNQAQARAVLFTVANPLMIWAVLAGAHNEALTLVFAIVALLFLRRYPFFAGVAIGLAGATKVSLVFYGLAMLWAYRFSLKRVLLLGVGALVPLGLAYGLWAPDALLAARRNVGYVSAGSWAPFFTEIFELFWPNDFSRQVVTWIGWAGMFVIAYLLSRVLPWSPAPGSLLGARIERDPLTVTCRTAVILTTAWLVTSPYSLSWYDIIVWVPLGMLAASKLDKIMVWRGGWLSVAYVAARAVKFDPEINQLNWVIRDLLCSAAQLLVLAALIAWGISGVRKNGWWGCFKPAGDHK
ncbi:MAG: hypothetical protein LBR21_08265 [Propionibacteriaceae bacterium]|jgi:hypothetical protein|nr:hypothetical protein [Propionibacteriaceae bacterium]